MAKSLVMLAEFAGVMYVALVVSRLVNMAARQGGAKPPQAPPPADGGA